MSIAAEITYNFVAPRQIVFGWGRRHEVGKLARRLGRRAFLISGSRTVAAAGVLDGIADALRAEGVVPGDTYTLCREPEVEDVDRTTTALREAGAGAGDCLLAVGGGAAIDLAKAVAAMVVNDESPTVKDYLEGVGKGLTIENAPLPVLAMPTTAGTGCEVTKNAVISSYDPPFKKSLRDERLVPVIALVDPELTASCPASVTAASGMDAITQLFESYISLKARPIPRALAAQGLKMAISAIAEAVRDGSSRPAREKMAHAAMLSGMCLANSGLGMAHGVAPALGVHCRVPHGAACAVMLPAALKVNRKVRQAELASLAHLLIGKGPSTAPEDAVEALIACVETLCDEVGAPRRLSQLGVTAEHIPGIVRSSRGSSMSGNPRELSDEELTAILEDLL
jgi:alcohol dehydrogenase class IV